MDKVGEEDVGTARNSRAVVDCAPVGFNLMQIRSGSLISPFARSGA